MNYRYLLCGLGIFFLLVGSATKVKDTLSDNAKVIRKIPTTQKIVALTIDDGPHPRTTPEILTVLREKKVKATFFVVGERVERFPDVFSQEVADGHEIGTHGYSHAYLSRISKDRIEPEIAKAEEAICKMAPRPTLYRPPGGEYNHEVLEAIERHHYKMILWSIDTRDWQSPPADKVVATVLGNIKPGSIILLHDGNYPLPTPKALGTVIDSLKENGYEFVTISELLQYYELRPAISLNL